VADTNHIGKRSWRARGLPNLLPYTLYRKYRRYQPTKTPKSKKIVPPVAKNLR
jgi:hypothetical protein